MSRSTSINTKHSSRLSHPNPFSGNSSDDVPLLPPSAANISGSLATYVGNNEEPYNLSFQDFSMMRRSNSRRMSHANADDVPTPSIGMDPAAYFAARSHSMANNKQSLSPFVNNSAPVNIPSSTNIFYEKYDDGSDDSNTPTLTTATTQPSEMSRQGSCRTEAANGFAMMSIGSTFSTISDVSAGDYTGGLTKSFLADEHNVLVRGIGGATVNPQFKDGNPQSMEMERSFSSESNTSTASSRSRDTLQRSNQLAATRKIQPKVEGKESSSKSSSSVKPIAITKASSYVRPKRDPLRCQKCNDKPEGYRGPHELNRHIQRAHSTQVKKWKIIEPTSDAISNDCPRMVKPISKCKACSDGKTYGIDYNAAAHLRRTHFVPKSKTKGRGSKVSSSDKAEKKSTKGSGDWPKMELLRPWLEEIMETKTADLVPEDDEYEEFDVRELDGILGEDLTTTDEPYHGRCLTNTVEELDGYPTPISNKGLDMTHTYSHQSHPKPRARPICSMSAMSNQLANVDDSSYVLGSTNHHLEFQTLNGSISTSNPAQMQYSPLDPTLNMDQTGLFDSPLMFDSLSMDMNSFNDNTYPSSEGYLFTNDITPTFFVNNV